MIKQWIYVLVFIGVQILLMFLVSRFIADNSGPFGNESTFALILVFAVVFLMTTLFILASGFAQINLTDRSQALGLPSGSVRAMIALILILIFIMFGTYLYTQELTYSKPIGPIVMEKNEWVGRVDVIQVESIPDSFPPRYNVWFDRGDPRNSRQLAQQLLTTVGTLVVAVAGFYFGSAGTASATLRARTGTGTGAVPNGESAAPSTSGDGSAPPGNGGEQTGEISEPERQEEVENSAPPADNA